MENLKAGEVALDISPPLGIDLGGFFVPLGKDRKVTEVRQTPYVRALVLSSNDRQIAIVSLDLLNLSGRWAREVRNAASQASGIHADNIYICVTHTHSMPGFQFTRRCGKCSVEFGLKVKGKVVEAIVQAQNDLLPAQLFLGQATVVGGSYNRTVEVWKTENQFDDQAAYKDRWLDRTLHAVSFRCQGRSEDIVWYHFSAHPACNNDTIAWPNWPGLVVDKLQARRGLRPSFLQGHCGDVHAGPGQPRLGDPEVTSEAVANALESALDNSQAIVVESLETCQTKITLPLDTERLQKDLNRYREHPESLNGEGWFDDEFVSDWAIGAAKWDPHKTKLKAVVSALKLGNLALLFHGSELYSYFGLKIRFSSPFRTTLSVGFANDYIGYLADPLAFENQEYAAYTAPRIFDLPPFQPEATNTFVDQTLQLLVQLNEQGNLNG